jgi:hypothetical protein
VASEQREQFADADAGDVRVDRPQFAADFGRRVRLGVPRIVLWWSAHQKEQHAAAGPAERTIIVRRGSARRAGQSHRQPAERADAKEIAAAQTVAHPLCRGANNEHPALP